MVIPRRLRAGRLGPDCACDVDKQLHRKTAILQQRKPRQRSWPQGSRAADLQCKRYMADAVAQPEPARVDPGRVDNVGLSQSWRVAGALWPSATRPSNCACCLSKRL